MEVRLGKVRQVRKGKVRQVRKGKVRAVWVFEGISDTSF